MVHWDKFSLAGGVFSPPVIPESGPVLSVLPFQRMGISLAQDWRAFSCRSDSRFIGSFSLHRRPRASPDRFRVIAQCRLDRADRGTWTPVETGIKEGIAINQKAINVFLSWVSISAADQ